jgi:hypothetical protein
LTVCASISVETSDCYLDVYSIGVALLFGGFLIHFQ